MKTIRYNTTDQSYTLHTGQYLTADGKLGRIDPPFVQLEVIETAIPEYDPTTEKLLPVTYDIEIDEGTHDLTGINGTATEGWTVEDKTEAELIAEATAKAEAADSELNPAQMKAAALKSITFEDDEEMLQFATLFPAWKPNIAVQVDEVYQFDGLLYKVIQAHTTQLDWTPPIVPALFNQVAAPGVIPDWVQPTGAHDAYNTGDQVMFEGQVWESLIDANTWSPTAYPAGWQLIS